MEMEGRVAAARSTEFSILYHYETMHAHIQPELGRCPIMSVEYKRGFSNGSRNMAAKEYLISDGPHRIRP